MCSHLVRATLLAQVLGTLQEELDSGACQDRPDARRRKGGPGHVPLLKRVREPSMEERLAKLGLSGPGQRPAVDQLGDEGE